MKGTEGTFLGFSHPRSRQKGLKDNVLILVTNDDGIYAPGLAALERQMRHLGDVCVVAPATEQSGVGHSITYLTPLIAKEVYHGDQPWGWAVEGSPADCVKIGIKQFCPRVPDLVVSGINSGFNAGINVLYSGTVAAAIEGAFFGITSVAVSLEFDDHADYEKAARLARGVIEQIHAQKSPGSQLYNVNIPTAALSGTPEVKTVPMNVIRYADTFERRIDPWGRDYFWLKGGPPTHPVGQETDLSALGRGCVTITPLDYNMTQPMVLADMQQWRFDLSSVEQDDPAPEYRRPIVRSGKKKQVVRQEERT
jgi:5'-nucleotidase